MYINPKLCEHLQLNRESFWQLMIMFDNWGMYGSLKDDTFCVTCQITPNDAVLLCISIYDTVFCMIYLNGVLHHTHDYFTQVEPTETICRLKLSGIAEEYDILTTSWWHHGHIMVILCPPNDDIMTTLWWHHGHIMITLWKHNNDIMTTWLWHYDHINMALWPHHDDITTTLWWHHHIMTCHHSFPVTMINNVQFKMSNSKTA